MEETRRKREMRDGKGREGESMDIGGVRKEEPRKIGV